jgi:hypothetical protein
MSDPNRFDRLWQRRQALVVILIVWLGGLESNGNRAKAAAEDAKTAAGRGTVVATAVSEKGTLVRRERAEANAWQILAQKEKLHAGDFLVGLPGAMLESQNGAVRLDFLADLDELSPYPIRECAVQLEESRNLDLNVRLDRGRMDLVNRKAKGAAHVRVQVRKDIFNFTLVEPGARVALELYGRWPRGVPFTKDPDPKHVPTATLLILALAGDVILGHEHHQHALKAPPGPALVEWDSFTGMDEAPRRLEQLPSWAVARGEDTPEGKKRKAALERFRQAVATKPIDTVVDELLKSENPADRRLAVYVLAALDNLSRLAQALRETKHLDVWENGVLALRHWIGRGPGQDQILYKRLIEVGKYKPIQAETVMQLLHSFGDSELAEPETYQTLIDYLDHDALAIRGLAYWHLSRLVPKGKALGYHPMDPKEAREAAIQKWRQLIPKGRVPPPPKATVGNK